MITALEYQERICCELSRARFFNFAHINIQDMTDEQRVKIIEKQRYKLHESLDYFFQCLEQPEKKERRRWWLDNKLEKIAMRGDLNTLPTDAPDTNQM